MNILGKKIPGIPFIKVRKGADRAKRVESVLVSRIG